VVFRGAEPTGFMSCTSPPIITEKAFRALLAQRKGALVYRETEMTTGEAAIQNCCNVESG
jgi:hypothetical protein